MATHPFNTVRVFHTGDRVRRSAYVHWREGNSPSVGSVGRIVGYGNALRTLWAVEFDEPVIGGHGCRLHGTTRAADGRGFFLSSEEIERI